MKTVNIMHTFTQRPIEYLFTDDAEAEQAHQAIKTALESYRQFKNEDQSVTVPGAGGENTFRLEHIISVGITDLEASEPLQIEWAGYMGRIRAAAKNAEDEAG